MTDTDVPIILETKALDVGYYKDLNILQNLNIKARKNKITAILGANGVGKSTALKAIFGFLTPNAGEVLLEGESIVNVPTYKKILKGLAYIPQQPGVFKDMTVEANLELGGWTFRKDKKQPLLIENQQQTSKKYNPFVHEENFICISDFYFLSK